MITVPMTLKDACSLEVSGECMLLGSVSSQQRFGVTDIKALSGLGQTVLKLSGLGQTLL